MNIVLLNTRPDQVLDCAARTATSANAEECKICKVGASASAREPFIDTEVAPYDNHPEFNTFSRRHILAVRHVVSTQVADWVKDCRVSHLG